MVVRRKAHCNSSVAPSTGLRMVNHLCTLGVSREYTWLAFLNHGAKTSRQVTQGLTPKLEDVHKEVVKEVW